MPQKLTIPRMCAYCCTPFLTNRRELSRGHGNYCSKSCAGRARAIPLTAQFWPQVARVADATSCWLWTGPTIPRGYGTMGGHRYAHRFAWELASGVSVPPGQRVLHTCDVPGCVRNDDEGVYLVNGLALPRFGHLFLGTHADNMADMRAKGRALTGERNPSRAQPEHVPHGADHWSRRMPERTPRGEQKVEAKLTDTTVREIRARYAAGGVYMRTLAAEYGVTRLAIHAVIHRKTWRHIP